MAAKIKSKVKQILLSIYKGIEKSGMDRARLHLKQRGYKVEW